jgi:hypothetical protein
MRKLFGLVMLLGTFWAVGCGGNSAPESGTKSAATESSAAVGEPKVVEPSQAGAAPAVAGNVMPPNEVVALFFDSMRRGDEVQTAGLLTTKAREELAKYELVVQPPGSPTATYQVGRVSFLDEEKDSAYVESILNEPTVTALKPSRGKSCGRCVWKLMDGRSQVLRSKSAKIKLRWLWILRMVLT